MSHPGATFGKGERTVIITITRTRKRTERRMTCLISQESVFLIKFLNWKIDLVVLIPVGRSFQSKDPELINVRSVKRVLDKGTTTLFSAANLVL